MPDEKTYYGGKYKDEMSPEVAKQIAMHRGLVTTDETPGQLQQILNDLMDPARHFVNAATLGASENAIRLATGDWETGAGYRPPSEGGLGTAISRIAGGMVPAMATGLAGTAATAGLSRLVPAIGAVPRIAQTLMGGVENAALGAAQGAMQTPGQLSGEGAIQGARNAVDPTQSLLGFGTSMGVPGMMRAIGYMYAKGIRMPRIWGIGPRLPAESYQNKIIPNKFSAWLNKAIPKGTVDPTIASPNDIPDVGQWEGMNNGLKNIADKHGIDLPLIAARPSDYIADWLTHKFGQLGAIKAYLAAQTRKNSATFIKKFQGVANQVGNSPELPPVATGNLLIKNWDTIVHTDNLDRASGLYEDILHTGLAKGGTLGDFPIEGTELADKLEALIESRGYTGIAATSSPEVNTLRSKVLSRLRPKEEEQTFLSVLGANGEQIPAEPPPVPRPTLNELWTAIKEVPWPRGYDNAAQTIKEAKMLGNAFIRDRAESINPNAGGLFEVADHYHRTGKTLDESPLGKIMSGRAEDVVDGLTHDVTTMRMVKEMLNDPTSGTSAGDQFIEVLAKRKLKGWVEGAIDPVSKNLDFTKLNSQITSWGGDVVSSKNEYIEELFGTNPEVKKNLVELHDLMQSIHAPSKMQSPQSISPITGGAEAQAMESAISKTDRFLSLMLRFAYGKKLGQFITTAPEAVNPLYGGLRPAMQGGIPKGILGLGLPAQQGDAPINLLNILRQAGGSAQRNF